MRITGIIVMFSVGGVILDDNVRFRWLGNSWNFIWPLAWHLRWTLLARQLTESKYPVSALVRHLEQGSIGVVDRSASSIESCRTCSGAQRKSLVRWLTQTRLEPSIIKTLARPMPGPFFDTSTILPVHDKLTYLIGHAVRSGPGMQSSSQGGTVVGSDEGNSGRFSARQLLLETSALSGLQI